MTFVLELASTRPTRLRGLIRVDPLLDLDPGLFVEGNLTNPVQANVPECTDAPANTVPAGCVPIGDPAAHTALHFDKPFLTDIAHNADPSGGLVPDADNTTSADFKAQPAGTYDDELLNAHFACGDGRCNENTFSTGTWASDPVTGVTATGLDSVDLWVGGLAEITNLFGGLLGSTFNYVFQNSLENLQDGDRFYYLLRTPGMNLRTQLEGNSFSELIMRNTDGTNTLKADAFATAD